MATDTIHTTTDHRKIQSWVEYRGGFPAKVINDHLYEPSQVLRINFPGIKYTEPIEEISWSEFFNIFEDNRLSFVYRQKVKNRPSRHFEFVDRNRAKQLTI